ncbi:MAG: AI-2E family transporter [Candidatus Pacearchaeota archaeon]
MMDDAYFKRVMTSILLIVLVVLTFLLVKPILMSIILGILLAFIFGPIYAWLHKKTKSKNLSAGIISTALTLLIILPFWFLTPIIIAQSFKIYQAALNFDLVTPLKTVFPVLFSSEGISAELVSIIQSFTSNTANFLVNSFARLILDFPTLVLQFLVMAFTFFYVLRDKEEIIVYIKSLLPFSKEVENKIFEYSKGITSSVLYGQVVIGLIQGISVGLGFYIFKVPNALFLTLIAVALGILPIIGTTIVWVPVAIYVLVTQGSVPAFGVTVFGLISNVVDNFLRPIMLARRTQINSALMLIGMIGGIFLFGILGFILGPLIIGYLLIVLEVYRNKKMPGLLIQPDQHPKS